MKNFIQFINEQRVQRGLSLKALFEANKLYVFRNGAKWLVESADQEQVIAVEQETEQQKQFTPEQFEQSVDQTATEVVQKQASQELTQAQATAKLKQIALEKISQGQEICDNCKDEETEQFKQGQQMIDDGHELLRQTEQAEEAVDAQAQVQDDAAAQLQVFQKAAQQAQDSVKVISSVVNDLIPPTSEITVPQLAKQTELIVRSEAIADSAAEVYQNAMQKQQQIIAQCGEEMQAQLKQQQEEQLNQQAQEEPLQKAQQKIQDVLQQVQELIDTVDSDELEIVKQCQETFEKVQSALKSVTDDIMFSGEKKLDQEVEQLDQADEDTQQAIQQIQDNLQAAKDGLEAAQVANAQAEQASPELNAEIDDAVEQIEAAQQQLKDDGELEQFVDQVQQIQEQVEKIKQIKLDQEVKLVQSQEGEEEQEVSLEAVADAIDQIKQMLDQVIGAQEPEEQEKQEQEEQEQEEQEEQEELVQEAQNDLPSEFKNSKPIDVKQLKQSLNDVAQIAGWVQSVWAEEQKAFSSKRFDVAAPETFKKIWDKYFSHSVDARQPFFNLSQSDVKDLAHWIVMSAINIIQDPAGQLRGHVENSEADKAESELVKLINHIIKRIDR